MARLSKATVLVLHLLIVLLLDQTSSFVKAFSRSIVRTQVSFRLSGSIPISLNSTNGTFSNEASTFGNGLGTQKRNLYIFQSINKQWQLSVADFKKYPWQYISIPIIAGLVGYVTNWLGVYMLFYPIDWVGVPIKRWAEQPLGLLGWQGVVPTKRFQMAKKMVDVTINQLITIQEMFSRLDPDDMAKILTSSLSSVVYGGLVPSGMLQTVMRRIASDMIKNIEKIVDIRRLVITGMTTDPRTLGLFFQKVGAAELKFLVNSGTYCGFALGLLQMIQWMVYPKGWTLPVGGALVGYVTNWIALKWIFEPLNPTKIGPFVFQGLFLTRQREVSNEFCSYITANVLNSKEVWKSIFDRSLPQFAELIRSNAAFLNNDQIKNIIGSLKRQLISDANADFHSLHKYINRQLNLRPTLIHRMNKLTPSQFEQVLHPIFQEDELTLIIAGGVLGAVAGLGQWWLASYLEKKAAKKKEKLPKEKCGHDKSRKEIEGKSLMAWKDWEGLL